MIDWFYRVFLAEPFCWEPGPHLDEHSAAYYDSNDWIGRG